MREVRRAGEAFRCPACQVGWVHLPPLAPARSHGRVVRCDRCRTLYRVQGAAGSDAAPPRGAGGDRDAQPVE